MIDILKSLPRNNKIILLIFIDLVSSYIALYISISILRAQLFFNIFEFPVIIFFVSVLFVPIFLSMGLYRDILRFSGFNFILKIFYGTFIYGSLFYIFNYFILFFYENLIISILQPLLFFILVLYSRLIIIFLLKEKNKIKKENIIVYGAGEAGYIISQKLNNINICCFVDDDQNKIKNRINNIPIYSSKNLKLLISEYQINFLLIAIPSLSLNRRNEILSKCKNYGVKVNILPTLDDLIIGNLKISQYDFIPSDFVERNIIWDKDKIYDFINNKVIFISGAGGSIGSELSRQIINMNPKTIILYDNSEFNLFKITNQITKLIDNNKNQTLLKSILGDIVNHNKLNIIFKKYKPNIVFHAAAYKHVNIVENNKIESIRNNVLGSYNLINTSVDFNVENFMFISTDKAIRPTSIMGASKRISEIILLNYRKSNQTKLSLVRFGNVINSNGSVIPLFQDQIKSGGPVTVTHPDVTRYFMSIAEAVGLVLEASIQAKHKDKFILNMGKPIKILDIAKKMISLSGHTNSLDEDNGDIKIEFIGLRSGEKMHEDLTIDNNLVKTNHDYIFKDEYDDSIDKNIEEIIFDINQILETQNEDQVSSFFKKYISHCKLV